MAPRVGRSRLGCAVLVALFLLPGLAAIGWRACVELVEFEASKPKPRR